MKSPPTTGSSGSSTDSKKVSSHPTGSGVQKSSSARTKKAIKVESRREEKKWQAFFDSAREVGADDDDETVRARFFDSFAEEGSTKAEAEAEAEQSSSKDTGEDSEYDVKGLMAHIYKDLHRVAAAQASKAASGGAGIQRVALGELSDTDLLLRDVSVGVASVISKFFFLTHPIPHNLNPYTDHTHPQNPHSPTYTIPKSRNPARCGTPTRKWPDAR